MCCACGGGEPTSINVIPYQPATICVNTDHDNVNSDGYPCSYLNILHDNENIAYDCETQADTSEFTASSMCCACGGGETWIRGTLPGDEKLVVKTHQPNIWTHRISLVQCMTPRDVLCTTLQVSTPRSSVVCVVEVSQRRFVDIVSRLNSQNIHVLISLNSTQTVLMCAQQPTTRSTSLRRKCVHRAWRRTRDATRYMVPDTRRGYM